MGFDYARLGRRIAEERKQFNKISQEKMAEDLGMYQADISNIEHAKKGSGITDLSKIELIADYLNVSLESLLFGHEIKQQVVRYSSALKIQDIDESSHIPKIHNDILKKIMWNNYEESLFGRYGVGPYTIYACCDEINCMNDD